MSTTTPTPRELQARADALADQAKELRRDLLEWHETKLTEVGIARDRAAREQYAAEQSAKSADIQVAREKADAAKLAKDAAEIDADVLAAEKKGDSRAAEEHRELAADYRNAAEVHTARARQAELDAAELREQAAQHARRVVELETQKTDLVKDGSEASEQIDLMEDQARLLDEAARKLTMAEVLKTTEPPGVDTRAVEIATLEIDAENALKKAGDIEVDQSKITTVLPDAKFEDPAAQASTSADTDAIETADPTIDAPIADTTDDAGALLDTNWLDEIIEDPVATPDLSDVDLGDPGLGYESTEVAFADTAAPGAEESYDDLGGMDDLA
jgi:hypothetical protein